MRGIAAAALVLLGAAAPAAAAERCALELILAVDVSGSIDDREFALQMEGMASAFEDPRLVEAVEAQKGGVLVTLTEWSGASRQRQVTAWHLLTDVDSMVAFAGAVRQSGRDWRNYSTAIGEALYHAMKVGETAPQECRRRVIDVSGDGVNNEGRAPRAIADALAAIGYTVNGLVIRGDMPDPVRHYEINVLAGPRAFIEIAAGFEDYPEAIRRKLLREIEERALVSELESRLDRGLKSGLDSGSRGGASRGRAAESSVVDFPADSGVLERIEPAVILRDGLVRDHRAGGAGRHRGAAGQEETGQQHGQNIEARNLHGTFLKNAAPRDHGAR